MKLLSETKSPQGVVAVVPFIKPATADTSERAVYLWEVQDPGNLGTIINQKVLALAAVLLLLKFTGVIKFHRGGDLGCGERSFYRQKPVIQLKYGVRIVTWVSYSAGLRVIPALISLFCKIV